METFYKFKNLLTLKELKSVFSLLILMLIGMAMEMLGIGLIIPIVTIFTQDDIAVKYPEIIPILNIFGNPSQEELLVGAMFLLIIIYAIKSFFLGFMIWVQMKFSYGVQVRLSKKLYEVYLKQPFTFHLQHNTAQLIRNITIGVSTYSSLLIQIMLLMTECLVLFGVSLLVIIIEPLGTILVAGLGIAAWGFHYFTRSSITRWGEILQDSEGLRLQYLQQGLGGVKDVKILGRENTFLNEYLSCASQSARVSRLNATIKHIPRLWLELLLISGLGGLVFSMVMLDRSTTEIAATLGLFAVAAFRIAPSINRITGSIQSLRYGLPIVNTLNEEFKYESNIEESEEQIQEFKFKSEIEFKDLSFTYTDNSEPALKNISLKIKQGQMIGVIGESGAGKSTLVDIILGLLMPNAGKVLVDGKDIKSNLRGWQRDIGYVPQSIFLTDESLRKNIAFGLSNEEIDDQAVDKAIKSAELSDFVNGLEEGIDTMVGERGVRISGGQRQRIGIARALYHNPDVLVLDEATSALDNETETKVMNSVLELHGDKTIIIIAHRLTTIEGCDKLIRLDKGKITEQGNTKKVLNKEA